MYAVFVLFHVGKERKALSKDALLRVDAARSYVETLPSPKDATVFFVGGGGLTPLSGSRRMKEYWKTHPRKAGVHAYACERSNTSLSNIEEIKSIIDRESFDSVTVITSNYHVPRIKRGLALLQVTGDVIGAEDILRQNNECTAEIEKYIESFQYKRKLFKEYCLAKLFLAESLFRRWRQKTYQ
jgi:hypothetical protein